MAEEIAPHRRTRANTATKVLEELDVRLRHGDVTDVEPVATGFDALDDVLGGGLHAGELLLLAGPPGAGKTIGALQWARNIAHSGGRAVLVCYEHEPVQLLLRLLTLELGELGDEGTTPLSLIAALQRERLEPEGLVSLLERSSEGRTALERFHRLPVVVISALDADGLRVSRTRLHHRRGSSAIAFESDVVVVLNDKDRAVSKMHLSYDPVRVRDFRHWTVMSVEKNRSGRALVDLEFRKDFAHFRFDPEDEL